MYKGIKYLKEYYNKKIITIDPLLSDFTLTGLRFGDIFIKDMLIKNH